MVGFDSTMFLQLKTHLLLVLLVFPPFVLDEWLFFMFSLSDNMMCFYVTDYVSLLLEFRW